MRSRILTTGTSLLTVLLGTQASAINDNITVLAPGSEPWELWVDVNPDMAGVQRCRRFPFDSMPGALAVDVRLFNPEPGKWPYAGTFHFRFDSTVLAYHSVTGPGASGSADGNTVTVTISNPPCIEYPVVSGGVIAQLHFTVLALGQSGADIDFFSDPLEWHYGDFGECIEGATFGLTILPAKGQVIIDGTGMRGCWTCNSNADDMDLDPGDGIADADPDPAIIKTTLRSAIWEGQATPAGDHIAFRIPGPNTTIMVGSTGLPLPLLGDVFNFGTTIDGTTQTLPPAGGGGPPPAPPVTLDGSLLGPGANGLVLVRPFNIVEGLAIVNFPASGVHIGSANGQFNTVRGCWIGVDATGTAAANGEGVRITASGHHNFIGDIFPEFGNLISGNTNDGVEISGGAHHNEVRNSFIGTNAAGSGAIPNGLAGVLIGGASNNTIGGTDPSARNVISGNGTNGIEIVNDPAGPDSALNKVQNNYIGLRATGTAALANGQDGVHITFGAHDNLIGGSTGSAGNVISGNGDDGVDINTASNTNLVQTNRIGVTPSGDAVLGNADNGVEISVGSKFNQIGGSIAGEENIISGNGSAGVEVRDPGTDENVIQENRIGTNSAAAPLGNGTFGVLIRLGARENTVTGNNIEANTLSGVVIRDSGTDQNHVLANFIGSASLPNTNGVWLDSGAEANDISNNAIGNNSADGILITGSDANVITGNTVLGNGAGPDGGSGIWIGGALNVVGGSIPAAGNTISGNLGDGVTIDGGVSNTVRGNTITFNAVAGVNVYPAGAGSGMPAGTGNAIRANSINVNGPPAGIAGEGPVVSGLGIDLGADSVTGNDLGDGDTGPNNSQNFPVLTSATARVSSTTIAGTLDSAPDSTYILEFFMNDACDESGHGEGQTFLGQHSVTTGGNGQVSFSAVLPGAASIGSMITATATDEGDPQVPDDGNSSEFSACVEVTPGASPCPEDCDGPPDGDVNILDFLALLAQWGLPGPCDFDDADNVADIEDFLQLLAAWGACP